MQPDSNQNGGQQPAPQSVPSPAAPPTPGVQTPQSPYAAPAGDISQQPTAAPVVTLTPDAPAPASMPTQPEPVAAEQPLPTDEYPAPEELTDETQPSATAPVSDEPVRWQAHEYIHHEKSALWFIIFGFVVAVLIAAAIFIINSWTFAILVPVMAAALLVYTHRPPRVLDYTLSRQGVHVNDHLYPFAEFKGFGVIHDGDEYSVMLIPTKRFKPGVTIYFPEESGEAIVDMLGARLPMQELHLDIVDKIIRKLRI